MNTNEQGGDTLPEEKMSESMRREKGAFICSKPELVKRKLSDFCDSKCKLVEERVQHNEAELDGRNQILACVHASQIITNVFACSQKDGVTV